MALCSRFNLSLGVFQDVFKTYIKYDGQTFSGTFGKLYNELLFSKGQRYSFL